MPDVTRPRGTWSSIDGFRLMRMIRARGAQPTQIQFTEDEIIVSFNGAGATALDAVLNEPPAVDALEVVEALLDPATTTQRKGDLLRALRTRRAWERGS
ncbi:MAG: hypothetical protein M3Q71_05660 [Chloroflexota bacterium]|nr:hypothetical protein [Chloroflexota bacterium]